MQEQETSLTLHRSHRMKNVFSILSKNKFFWEFARKVLVYASQKPNQSFQQCHFPEWLNRNSTLFFNFLFHFLTNSCWRFHLHFCFHFQHCFVWVTKTETEMAPLRPGVSCCQRPGWMERARASSQSQFL